MRLSKLLLFVWLMLGASYAHAQFPCISGQISLAPGYEASLCGDDTDNAIIGFRSTPVGIPHAFVVVDANDVIVYIGYNGLINFSDLGTGLRVYSFNLIGSILAEVGDVLGEVQLSSGCSAISSNFIEIDSSGGQEGGTLEGGPFTFCVGDGEADMIEMGAITLTGNSGDNFAWVVTDDQGNILGLPASPSDVNFDDAGPGTCLVWHLSFQDGLEGAEVGLNANDLEGCFDLSNPISVFRNQPDGGTLEGGPFTFCVGDGEADMIEMDAITLTGNSGTNSAWVITDDQGNILGLPPSFSDVNFDEAGPGNCLVWHLSFEDGLMGAEVGLNANDLEGCFDLSNPITVVRNQPEGGTLEGGPFTFCVGDGEADMIEMDAITLTGNSGTNSAWVITDDQGNILGLPASFSDVNFDEAGPGNCLVWHLSFEDGLEGAEVGLNANDLEGCFSLSNPITVVRNQPDGGTLEGGPFSFCVGDGEADMIEMNAITLTGNSGTNSAWVITDDQGNILGLPASFSDVNFDEAGVGTCLVWHLSFEDGLEGAEVGLNANDLQGCFDLSNPISVFRDQPDGGTLEGGVYNFCVNDGEEDNVSGIFLTGNSGTNSAWVVTDDQGNILGLPASPEDVNFDEADPGVCLIWHLSFADGLMGAEVGMNAADLQGCFDLSNPITVNRVAGDDCDSLCNVNGGFLEGGPFTFCVGDGVADTIEMGAIALMGNSGTNSAWVVTDDQGNILGLPPSPSDVNFDEAGPGNCLVWHISFEDGLMGAEVGMNAADLEGCFDLSNPITVVRNQPEGGTLEGGPFTFCVGDGEADMIAMDAITLTGNSGTNSAWVITDDQGNILGLPASFSDVNFDEAGPGNCLVWHLSFEDGLMGAEVGLNANDLQGCFSLSNPITVVRNQPDGGTLEGGPFTFCVGDGEADMIEMGAITLTGNSGTNSAWVITDDQGNILGLPASFSDVNFDDAGPGNCLVWHLSFEDGLMGAEVGMNANDLQGCFDLSNPITVVRNQPDGGTLEGGVYNFCVNDGTEDNVSGIFLTGNSGTNSAWVVTDDQGNILGLPASPEDVNFDEADPGTCLIWHLSFEDGLMGAEVGMNANDLQGCFDLSNPITVNRVVGEECDSLCNVNGGFLEGGPFTFCVGDGVADTIEMGAITLMGNSGTNSAWVITDDQGNILGLPASFSDVNFDEAGPGNCLVWHISFEDGLMGAEVGMNAADLQGCFDLSNPITVVRNQPEGGTLEGGPFTFCVGDGEADMIEMGAITLTGNSGTNSAWVVTDDQGNILGLPPMPSEVNFDEAGPGNCLVWHLSFEDGLMGAEVGMNANDLQGCFSLSNPITVERIETDGGTVATADTLTEITVTVGDGEDDMITFTSTGAVGDNFTFVVTDDNNNILALPEADMVNFEEAGVGICRVWGLAYTGDITAMIGDNAAEVALTDGCFSLSENFVTVNRVEGFQGTLPGDTQRDVAVNTQVQIFPNPVSDLLQVQIKRLFESTQSERLNITILDLNGKVIYQQLLNAETQDLTVPVAQWPAGTYILSVNTGQELINKRFVKS